MGNTKTVHYLVSPKNRLRLCGEMLVVLYEEGAELQKVEFCYPNEPDELSPLFWRHYQEVLRVNNLERETEFSPKVEVKIMTPDDCRRFLESKGRYDLDPDWPHLYSYTSWIEE